MAKYEMFMVRRGWTWLCLKDTEAKYLLDDLIPFLIHENNTLLTLDDVKKLKRILHNLKS